MDFSFSSPPTFWDHLLCIRALQSEGETPKPWGGARAVPDGSSPPGLPSRVFLYENCPSPGMQRYFKVSGFNTNPGIQSRRLTQRFLWTSRAEKSMAGNAWESEGHGGCSASLVAVFYKGHLQGNFNSAEAPLTIFMDSAFNSKSRHCYANINLEEILCYCF